jgi:hypothetical protein
MATQPEWHHVTTGRRAPYLYSSGPPQSHGRGSQRLDDGDLLYPEVQPSIAGRHQNLRNPHRPGPIPIRRRSVSTSPGRGRVRQRNTYPGTMPYRRQQSHSDEDREAVRRARDIGVRSSSSEPPLPNKRGTLHLMTERKQAAERIIAIDKERARDQENVPSDSAALGTSPTTFFS